jgi:lysozyme
MNKEKLPLDTNKLRAQLIIDEGQVNEVYLDHLGYPTMGIGHLIIAGDPEEFMGTGHPVTEDRVIEAFEKDVQIVLDDCVLCFESWYKYPEEARQVFANMMFNMGRTRLSKFKNMIKAAEEGDWNQVAVEGRDSRWYKQVTNRAERLMSRLENI